MKALILYFDRHAARLSMETHHENGGDQLVLSYPHNFAMKGDALAQVVEAVSEEELKKKILPGMPYHEVLKYFVVNAGRGVHHNPEDGTFRAKYYGFVAMDPKSGLHVVAPLQVTQDKARAYYLVHPANSGKLPIYADIEETLHAAKITMPVDAGIVTAELSKINPTKPEVTRVLVAQTTQEAVNGRPEFFTLLIDTEKKAGRILADGRMDYHEQESVVQVLKGTPVLNRFPAMTAVDGMDIFSNQVQAKQLENPGFAAGENLVPSPQDENVWVSAIDGCLSVKDKKVDIKPILTIEGDVDFKTGNISFQGDVIIKGYVHSGFSVKAAGNITVEMDVEDALIECGGLLVVKMGLSGKGDTRVTAGGGVEAKFMLNSTVEADGPVTVSDSIVNSHVFSNARVTVTGKHGKIMGGSITALERIEVNTVGSQALSHTVLATGRNLRLEKEIEAVRADETRYQLELEQVKSRLQAAFGEALWDNPKLFISKLPPFRQKLCIDLLKEESHAVHEMTEVKKKIEELENRLVLKTAPDIIVHERIYAGALIQIIRQKYSVEKDIENARFYISPETKTVVFEPAGTKEL